MLANYRRLRIFGCLLAGGPMTVEQVARVTGLSPCTATLYLRQLNARGFLVAERLSRYVIYRVQADPLLPNNRELFESLRMELRADDHVIRDIYRWLTAFTHPRRVAIVQRLVEKDMSFSELQTATGMSAQALGRHLQKLRSRGYVEKQDSRYHLVGIEGGFKKALLETALRSPT